MVTGSRSWGFGHGFPGSPGKRITSPCGDCCPCHLPGSVPPEAPHPRPPSSLLHPTVKGLCSGQRSLQVPLGACQGCPHRLVPFSPHSILLGCSGCGRRKRRNRTIWVQLMAPRACRGPCTGLPRTPGQEVLATAGGRPAYSLVDGLQELALVLPDFGVVDLLQQLRVLVDEPRFPEDVGCCVLDLGKTNKTSGSQVVSWFRGLCLWRQLRPSTL